MQTSARIARPLWRVAVEGWGTPAADAHTVFSLTKHHEVIAVDAASAQIRWRRRTGEPGETTFGSRLALAGDLVIAGDYNVLALDRHTGALRWRFEPQHGYGPGIYLGPAVNGLVLTGSASGHLYAIDVVNGRLKWTVRIASGKSTVFPPARHGDLVVAAFTTFGPPNAGGIAALDATTGREQWRFEFETDSAQPGTGEWGGGPVFAGHDVVVASRSGSVYAIDRARGVARWSLPPLQRPRVAALGARTDFRALAVSGRILIVGSLSGRLLAYNLHTREERWRYASPANGAIAFNLDADREFVYVPFVEGCLVAVSLSDGRERWRTDTAGFHWPPSIAGSRLYALSSTQGLLAFERPVAR